MLRSEFPLLKNNEALSYLDNASTTHKPYPVIESLTTFYTGQNANVHRGLYPLSEMATSSYEQARRKVADFIGAEQNEIIFTSGTTDSLNGLANSLKESKLINLESKILLSELEHHSNLLPWQRLSRNLAYIPLTKAWELDWEWISEYRKKNPNPALIAITLVSNVTGTLNDVEKLRELFPHSLLVADAAQAVAHAPINVNKLGVDFLAFSGHKLYGPTGIGVLYGRRDLLSQLEPFRVGGGMIREVHRDHSSWADLSEKFEAGTPPIAEAIGLAAAIDYIAEVGWTKIQAHEDRLAAIAAAKLRSIPGLTLFQNPDKQSTVLSFVIEGFHPHDLAQILGQEGVAVRAGHHCCQILHHSLGVAASTRVSLAMYNTEEDIERLITTLSKAIDLLA